MLLKKALNQRIERLSTNGRFDNGFVSHLNMSFFIIVSVVLLSLFSLASFFFLLSKYKCHIINVFWVTHTMNAWFGWPLHYYLSVVVLLFDFCCINKLQFFSRIYPIYSSYFLSLLGESFSVFLFCICKYVSIWSVMIVMENSQIWQVIDYIKWNSVLQSMHRPFK